MGEKRMPEVGQHVVFHDAKGVGHDALITCVHFEECVNLVFVSGDESRQDTNGRQIERDSSSQHKSVVGGVHGHYWRFLDEEPNEFSVPAAT
jgi:hypothetical protein